MTPPPQKKNNIRAGIISTVIENMEHMYINDINNLFLS